MKKLIFTNIIVLILLFSIPNYSQGKMSGMADGRVNMTDEFEIRSSINFIEVDVTSKKVTGSSYLSEDFLLTKLSNSKVIYLMRYNAFRDEMEVELRGKPFYLPLSTNSLINFYTRNKTYQSLNFKEKDNLIQGFFVVLYRSDKISLFLKEKIKLYKEVPAKLGFTPYEPPSLKRVKDILYVSLGNSSTVVELPRKGKDFFRLFSSKEKDVKSYSKKNKLNLKRKEDLIRIFEYYNTLL